MASGPRRLRRAAAAGRRYVAGRPAAGGGAGGPGEFGVRGGGAPGRRAANGGAGDWEAELLAALELPHEAGPRTGAAPARPGRDRRSPPAPPPAAVAVRGECYGCGAALQVGEADQPGHVELEKYLQKRKHKQLRQVLCGRCTRLHQGKMIPGVQDFGAKLEAQENRAAGFTFKKLIAADALREELTPLRRKKVLVLLLVDILDASGSFLNKVRDLVAGNPIVLVGTKADLLPEGTDLGAVAEWLREEAASRRLTLAQTHLVSSRSGQGLARAAGGIRRERRGRDVYVIGPANVGKSAFIRALVKELGNLQSVAFETAAAANSKQLPTVSGMPGTTLATIPVNAFSDGAALFDTPGLHLDYRALHLLRPADVKGLLTRKRLKAYVAPSPAQIASEQLLRGRPGMEALALGVAGLRVAGSASYLWGGLARIDIEEAPSDTYAVFYSPQGLRVRTLPFQAAGFASEADLGACVDLAAEGPPFGWPSVRDRGGLTFHRSVELTRRPTGAGREVVPVVDVAVAGVGGWVSIHMGPGEDLATKVHAWTPRGVQSYFRPPLPVPFSYEV